MAKGRLFIVSGPSGSGKDTVLEKALQSRPDIKVSISCVTRAIRNNEIDGVNYHFISREQFMDMIERGELLEYNEYVGNFYGTPKAPVDLAVAEGRDFILKIDVNGANNVKKIVPDAVRIFIMPPSLEVLKSRLSGRGSETEETLNNRLCVALEEIKCAAEYDYIVVNDDLSKAAEDLLCIINSDALKTDRNIEILNGVVKNDE